MSNFETLGISVANKLLAEQNRIVDKLVLYIGNFQPFHLQNYNTYKLLVDKFDKSHVQIITTNEVDTDTLLLTFDQKKKIMSDMYDINNIICLDSFDTISDTYNDTDLPLILVYDNDIDIPTNQKKTETYHDTIDLLPNSDVHYVYKPSTVSNIFVDDIIRHLGAPSYSIEMKKMWFAEYFGEFDEGVFNLLVNIYTRGCVMEWLVDVNGHILESLSSAIGPDDGPGFVYPSFEAFKNATKADLNPLLSTGWNILNYMVMDDKELPLNPPMYPNGPVNSVSYFPAGDFDVNTPTNQEDIYGVGAYNKWKAHISRAVELLGWEFAQSKQQDRLTKSLSTRDAKGIKTADRHKMNESTSITKDDIDRVSRYADTKMRPIDINLRTKHFFQRLLDPRNKIPINIDELYDYFDRLSKYKGALLDVLKKYKEIVLVDKKTNINIPFVREVNKLIAKTILRKKDFKSPNPKLSFEHDAVDELLRVVIDETLKRTSTNISIPTTLELNDEEILSESKASGSYRVFGITNWKDSEFGDAESGDSIDSGGGMGEVNNIVGGLGDNATVKKLADMHNVKESQVQYELSLGVKVEMEHTTNDEIAKEIALDHLTEDPIYYTKLAKIESPIKVESTSKITHYKRYFRNLSPATFNVMAEELSNRIIIEIPHKD